MSEFKPLTPTQSAMLRMKIKLKHGTISKFLNEKGIHPNTFYDACNGIRRSDDILAAAELEIKNLR